MASILNDVKHVCGIEPDYTHFDKDILLYTNDTFSTLNQLGVGPAGGFFIFNADATWEDYLGEDCNYLSNVQAYVCKRVRLAFDPPMSSTILQALKEQIAESEWRISVAVDPAAGNVFRRGDSIVH